MDVPKELERTADELRAMLLAIQPTQRYFDWIRFKSDLESHARILESLAAQLRKNQDCKP